MAEAAGMQRVLGRFLAAYAHTHRLSPRQRAVCNHIGACRTAALGGMRVRCAHCDYDIVHYHACRDRHCPRCQHHDAARWCERQRQALLPVPYYHVVFTLPHTLNRWVQLHPRVLYALLFESVWATLKRFGADPRHLGGALGMSAVLHTWGENLSQHVHLHCLIPGGALGADGRWRAARSTYLFPVRALSRRFRGTMVTALRRAHTRGALHRITRPGDVDVTLDTLMQREWVVHSKACVSHTDTVLTYLARYTHRTAISDRRIVAIDDERVRFLGKNTRGAGARTVISLPGEEFLRRFLLHVLPKGLMRIRHYGWLANRCRRVCLARIRVSLAQASETERPPLQAPSPMPPFDDYRCPRCAEGYLRVHALLAPMRWAGSG